MIIKGKSRARPMKLALHLENAKDNENVSLLETRGTLADDLRGALIEMHAHAAGTRCRKPLYHAAISPAPPHRLSPGDRAQSIDALEKELGFVGQARVVVLHEKHGREHIHVVWSRIDLDRMVSISDSHNYRKHEKVARELERRFGHERVQGAHHEREGVKRPDRTPSRAELRQEERTGIKGKQVKEEVTAAFRASDGAEAFKAALEDCGYVLAQGDRRDFVIVDRAGGIHSLARRIDGMKAAELRAFMKSVPPDTLPTVSDARAVVEASRNPFLDSEDASDAARRQRDFAHGADYVSQTQAALKEHIERQKKLDETSRQSKPQRDPKTESKIAQLLDDIAEEDRLMNLRRDPSDDDPSSQSKAPGGGRTRSR